MSTGRARSRLSRSAAVSAGLAAVLLGAPAVGAVPQVVQDQAQFQATGDVAAVPFADDADTAFAVRPFAGLVGHSCTDAAAGVDLGEVTVAAPAAGQWLCYVDEDWNTPAANISPRPTAPTIIASGEDDFVLTFAEPVNALGLGLLTNFAARERITVTAPDGSTTVFEDAALGTAPNSLEFVGLTAPEGIRSVSIDTTGGALQNTGITGIAAARTPPVAVVAEVAVDIKPGNARNCVNPRAAGVVPVAVLSENGFDARTLDAGTVALEGAPARPRGHSGHVGTLKDVDGDGDLDLLVHIGPPSVLAGQTDAELTGTTRDGTAVRGQDHLCATPPGSAAARPPR